MFQYHCLNPIAEKGLKLFGDNYKKTESADQCDAILAKAVKMQDNREAGGLRLPAGSKGR